MIIKVDKKKYDGVVKIQNFKSIIPWKSMEFIFWTQKKNSQIFYYYSTTSDFQTFNTGSRFGSIRVVVVWVQFLNQRELSWYTVDANL